MESSLRNGTREMRITNSNGQLSAEKLALWSTLFRSFRSSFRDVFTWDKGAGVYEFLV